MPIALGALTLLGLLILDEPVARYAKGVRSPSVLRELYDVSHAIGNTVGILILGWLIVEFDGSGEAAGRVVFLGLGAGLFALGIDHLVNLLPVGHQPNAAPFAPLAQLAAGVAVAIALTSIYPNSWRLVTTMATLLALARLAGTAHVSDVCGGAFVGWLFAMAWLRSPALRPLLKEIEASVAWLLFRAGWIR